VGTPFYRLWPVLRWENLGVRWSNWAERGIGVKMLPRGVAQRRGPSAVPWRHDRARCSRQMRLSCAYVAQFETDSLVRSSFIVPLPVSSALAMPWLLKTIWLALLLFLHPHFAHCTVKPPNFPFSHFRSLVGRRRQSRVFLSTHPSCSHRAYRQRLLFQREVNCELYACMARAQSDVVSIPGLLYSTNPQEATLPWVALAAPKSCQG